MQAMRRFVMAFLLTVLSFLRLHLVCISSIPTEAIMWSLPKHDFFVETCRWQHTVASQKGVVSWGKQTGISSAQSLLPTFLSETPEARKTAHYYYKREEEFRFTMKSCKKQ